MTTIRKMIIEPEPAQAQHTPVPWQTDGRWISASDFRPGTLFIADCAVSSGYRSQEETKANAQLIVRACNNVQRLADALRDSVSAMERMDARLLTLTNSPKECEKGEIVRGREALAEYESEVRA